MSAIITRTLTALLFAATLASPAVAWAAEPTRSKIASDVYDPSFDYSQYPDERKILEGSEGFPKLRDYGVLAPSTKRYNCIAWSLGITDRWVWPGTSLIAFDILYAKHGYKRLGTRDTDLEAGVEKIVLYGKYETVRLKGADGQVREEALFVATHAAWQEVDGTWSSKLGALARIGHLTPEALSSATYGDPAVVYARARR